MVRITLVACLLMLLSACKQSEPQPPTPLINNYVFFDAFEYMPHSKIISKQTIIGSDQRIINTNADGFLTLIETKEVTKTHQFSEDDKITESKMIIDYQAAKTIMTNSDDNQLPSNFDMQFDNHNNISKLESLDQRMTWLGTYDDQNRLIKITRTTNPSLMTSIITIAYDKQQIQKITSDILWEQQLLLKQTKQFFYDEQQRLNKIIINTRKVMDKSSDPTIECSFYDYNENGDWTKSYCLKAKQNHTHFTLRKITY
ncbi:hypothetical protein [uncultured Gilliamella sp.]|uniref:hypothetical protein n=1 Tax=uncultured Gilliamella sp. TaxID=1193505 RepID=UPI0025CCCBD6|nr:hypothetical protein [uncultured Gilliamella sp.]